MNPAPFRVLFVCMGNICRSPAAEGVMRALAAQAGVAVHVESAGTIGYHAGEPPDRRMIAAAKRRGYDLVSRARQVERADFEKFDLILTMDDANLRGVLGLASNDTERAKVARFTTYCREHPGATEVPDPYYGGGEGFERVLDLLEDGCRGLLCARGQ
jgi:protein-tyrosine phosphatase